MRSTPLPVAEPLLRGQLAAAGAALRLGAAQTLAAWPVLASRCLFYVFILVVISALWDKVASEQVARLAAVAPVAGFAVYVGVTEWITLAVPATHLRLEDDIRGGGLEPHLLRPKSYLVQVLAEQFGGALVRLAALGATGLILLGMSGRGPPSLEVFLRVLPLGVLALAVGVLLYAVAGLGAFWARRTLPFQLVIQKLAFVLGGLFAPISLYPEPLRVLSQASPFAAHLYWAGAQALAPSVEGLLVGLALQVFWIGFLAALCFALWRAGLAKVLREGGA